MSRSCKSLGRNAMPAYEGHPSLSVDTTAFLSIDADDKTRTSTATQVCRDVIHSKSAKQIRRCQVVEQLVTSELEWAASTIVPEASATVDDVPIEREQYQGSSAAASRLTTVPELSTTGTHAPSGTATSSAVDGILTSDAPNRPVRAL